MELNEELEELVSNILINLDRLNQSILEFKEKWEPELAKQKSKFLLLQEHIKIESENKKSVKNEISDIDTNILMRDMKNFLRSQQITRDYFSKKVLLMHREYLLEILDHPLPWSKLSKIGRKPYLLIHEFLNDKNKIESFLKEHEEAFLNSAEDTVINIKFDFD
jgi:hypothetical protein